MSERRLGKLRNKIVSFISSSRNFGARDVYMSVSTTLNKRVGLWFLKLIFSSNVLWLLKVVLNWRFVLSIYFSITHVLGSCSFHTQCVAFYLFIYLFWWDWDFVLAKQRLYYLSHTSSPFWSDYFGDGISGTICLDWPQTTILLINLSLPSS
jgi:hypothetical protein